MNTLPVSIFRVRGFSVVELLVSVAIGMLALLFATRLLTGAESNKQAAIGGSDSMQNGMLAMFSISNDAAQSGFGLNDPIIAGCNTVLNDANGYQLATAARGGATVAPLAAAVIENNGANPDRLSLYAGSSLGGTATLRVTGNYANGTRLNVDRIPYGFAIGDVIVVAPEAPGANCAMAQVTGVPTDLEAPPAQQYIRFETGRRFNNGTLGAEFTGGAARVFNLGPEAGLQLHTWSVGGGFLQLRSTDMNGAGDSPATVADNIVSIKAQYGLDTRVGANFLPESGMQVGRWSASMTDADSDGVVGGSGDYQRIAALRIAVVARSKAPERAAPGAAECSATTAQPEVFGSAGAGGAAAVSVAVNVAVTDDPVSWKCYRYRVFETVVPLRNAGWRPTA